jgi:probable HAF family extracellular repeat protein
MVILAAMAVPVPSSAQALQQNQQVRYLVFTLGTFGGTFGAGNAINDLGWVMGNANPAGDQTTNAALWIYGRKFNLGTLGGPNSAVLWPVHNNQGVIAGVSDTSIIDTLNENWSCAAFFPPSHAGHTCQGFLWQDGVMTALPTLGGPNGFAAGVNNKGQVVGWAENTVHDPTCNAPGQILQFEAVLYNGEHAPTQLPPWPGDPDGAATDINDKGQIVGISGLCSNAVGGASAKHALLWQNGVPTDLGNLGGGAWNTPNAINNRGQVVGFGNTTGDENAPFNPTAFLWTKERGMQNLHALPGDAVSEGLGINDRGQVVGESCVDNTFSSCRAFLWQNGVLTDLNALLLKPGHFSLVFANDINSFGAIAGGAFDTARNELVAFIAVPSPFGAGAHPAQLAQDAASRVILPASVREQLSGLSRFSIRAKKPQ